MILFLLVRFSTTYPWICSLSTVKSAVNLTHFPTGPQIPTVYPGETESAESGRTGTYPKAEGDDLGYANVLLSMSFFFKGPQITGH